MGLYRGWGLLGFMEFDGKCWKVYRLIFVPAPEMPSSIHSGGMASRRFVALPAYGIFRGGNLQWSAYHLYHMCKQNRIELELAQG